MIKSSWVLVVAADVDADIEADWNEWYDRTHAPDALACPGVRHCTRLVTEEPARLHGLEPRPGETGRAYVAIYEVDGPHIQSTREFMAMRGWDRFAGKVRSSTRCYKVRGQKFPPG